MVHFSCTKTRLAAVRAAVGPEAAQTLPRRQLKFASSITMTTSCRPSRVDLLEAWRRLRPTPCARRRGAGDIDAHLVLTSKAFPIPRATVTRLTTARDAILFENPDEFSPRAASAWRAPTTCSRDKGGMIFRRTPSDNSRWMTQSRRACGRTGELAASSDGRSFRIDAGLTAMKRSGRRLPVAPRVRQHLPLSRVMLAPTVLRSAIVGRCETTLCARGRAPGATVVRLTRAQSHAHVVALRLLEDTAQSSGPPIRFSNPRPNEGIRRRPKL